MKRPLTASLLASTAIFSTPVLAQDIVFDLDPIIIESGSLTPVEQARSGANVEVLEGADAGAEDSRVLDRLVRLPGVNLTSNGGLGALGTIQVRGLPSRYVAVRIDGIDVSDPSGTQNQFNFGGFTASGVDRVEVLKGSQSAIYGSEAIAGVVNITTFEPVELGFSGKASVEAGSFDTYSGSFSVGHKSERGYVALSHGRVESNGISAQSFNTERDGFSQTTTNLTGAYDVSDSVTVGGAVLYRDGYVEIDRSSFSSDPSGEIYSDERGARVFAEIDAGGISHTLSFSRFDITREDPGGFTTLFEGTRDTLAYLGSAELGARTTLNFGIDRTEESINSGAAVGSEDNTSLTSELLFSASDAVDLSVALRHDDNSTFGGETTGRLTAVYRPSDDLAFRASVGTGYRAPSLYERFSVYGVPTLQPEKSVGVELGVEKTLGDRGVVKATIFQTEVDDLIEFDSASVVCSSGFGCYNQVPGTTTAKGFEISGDYDLTDRTAIYGAYTYTDAKTDGTRLTRTPMHEAVLGVSSDFTDRVTGYVDIRGVFDVVPSAFAPTGHKVGDYTLVGLGVSYDVTDATELYLRVENLFDEDYETAGGFNQPGRAVFVGARAEF